VRKRRFPLLCDSGIKFGCVKAHFEYICNKDFSGIYVENQFWPYTNENDLVEAIYADVLESPNSDNLYNTCNFGLRNEDNVRSTFALGLEDIDNYKLLFKEEELDGYLISKLFNSFYFVEGNYTTDLGWRLTTSNVDGYLCCKDSLPELTSTDIISSFKSELFDKTNCITNLHTLKSNIISDVEFYNNYYSIQSKSLIPSFSDSTFSFGSLSFNDCDVINVLPSRSLSVCESCFAGISSKNVELNNNYISDVDTLSFVGNMDSLYNAEILNLDAYNNYITSCGDNCLDLSILNDYETSSLEYRVLLISLNNSILDYEIYGNNVVTYLSNDWTFPDFNSLVNDTFYNTFINEFTPIKTDWDSSLLEEYKYISLNSVSVLLVEEIDDKSTILNLYNDMLNCYSNFNSSSCLVADVLKDVMSTRRGLFELAYKTEIENEFLILVNKEDECGPLFTSNYNYIEDISLLKLFGEDSCDVFDYSYVESIDSNIGGTPLLDLYVGGPDGDFVSIDDCKARCNALSDCTHMVVTNTDDRCWLRTFSGGLNSDLNFKVLSKRRTFNSVKFISCKSLFLSTVNTMESICLNKYNEIYNLYLDSFDSEISTLFSYINSNCVNNNSDLCIKLISYYNSIIFLNFNIKTFERSDIHAAMNVIYNRDDANVIYPVVHFNNLCNDFIKGDDCIEFLISKHCENVDSAYTVDFKVEYGWIKNIHDIYTVEHIVKSFCSNIVYIVNEFSLDSDCSTSNLDLYDGTKWYLNLFLNSLSSNCNEFTVPNPNDNCIPLLYDIICPEDPNEISPYDNRWWDGFSLSNTINDIRDGGGHPFCTSFKVPFTHYENVYSDNIIMLNDMNNFCENNKLIFSPCIGK
jgi:hypothetical protein